VSTSENHLITLLPRKERLHLLGLCESVSLGLSEVLYVPGQPTRHIYFPTDGYISLIASIDGKPGLEVGIVGREGMLGVQIALGVPTAPLHALVQGPGTAWRISTKVFGAELASSAALQRGINSYIYVLMSQMATASACLRFHLIGQRLARWLLVSQDRAGRDSFPVTQQFLSYMLGVRRVGVTAAAGVMQRNGLIEYHRGDLKVLDRAGLEAAACSCYAADRLTYTETLG
jgi:CRP-like cAMP-binding protein